MTTPSFDPQPCQPAGAIPEPLDVNVVSPDPVNVLVTNQLAEPLDVNVVSTVPGTVSIGGSTVAANTLNAVSAAGNGATVDFTAARSDVALFVQVNGTVTGGTVSLQASQDGINWARVASTGPLVTGTNQYLGISGGAFRWFRGAVSEAVTGGGTVTATLMYA